MHAWNAGRPQGSVRKNGEASTYTDITASKKEGKKTKLNDINLIIWIITKKIWKNTFQYSSIIHHEKKKNLPKVVEHLNPTNLQQNITH